MSHCRKIITDCEDEKYERLFPKIFKEWNVPRLMEVISQVRKKSKVRTVWARMKKGTIIGISDERKETGRHPLSIKYTTAVILCHRMAQNISQNATYLMRCNVDLAQRNPAQQSQLLGNVYPRLIAEHNDNTTLNCWSNRHSLVLKPQDKLWPILWVKFWCLCNHVISLFLLQDSKW